MSRIRRWTVARFFIYLAVTQALYVSLIVVFGTSVFYAWLVTEVVVILCIVHYRQGLKRRLAKLDEEESE